MTVREYKKLCRIKVERLAKIITVTLVLSVLTVGSVFAINGYIVGVISTLIWFFAPDVAAYALECKYKLKHDRITYR